LEICRGLPSDAPPPAALVELALRSHGLIEPPPHLVVLDLPAGDGRGDLPRGLDERFRGVMRDAVYARVGIAVCEPALTPLRRRAVVALMESGAEIVPIPRAARIGRRLPLRLKVPAGYRDPQLIVSGPRGEITTRPLSRQADGWQRSTFVCATKGTYRVELTALGRFGSEVLAIFPIYCGVQPPLSVQLMPKPPRLESVAAMEERAVLLTNRARREADLAPLRVNRALAAVARRHGQDMVTKRFVGHVSPTTGTPADRLRRAGISFSVLRENVARAYSIDEALQELLNSPAHRANLLSSDVSEIGVGVVVHREGGLPVLLVTQNFIQPR
jgi:uncharacterized protein YkwD